MMELHQCYSSMGLAGIKSTTVARKVFFDMSSLTFKGVVECWLELYHCLRPKRNCIVPMIFLAKTITLVLTDIYREEDIISLIWLRMLLNCNWPTPSARNPSIYRGIFSFFKKSKIRETLIGFPSAPFIAKNWCNENQKEIIEVLCCRRSTAQKRF